MLLDWSALDLTRSITKHTHIYIYIYPPRHWLYQRQGKWGGEQEVRVSSLACLLWWVILHLYSDNKISIAYDNSIPSYLKKANVCDEIIWGQIVSIYKRIKFLLITRWYANEDWLNSNVDGIKNERCSASADGTLNFMNSCPLKFKINSWWYSILLHLWDFFSFIFLTWFSSFTREKWKFIKIRAEVTHLRLKNVKEDDFNPIRPHALALSRELLQWNSTVRWGPDPVKEQ